MAFISVLLLHSGHTSKLQFFHCFSIVSRVLYAIMVPHRGLNFTIGIILPSPYSISIRFASRLLGINFPSVLLKFSIAFPLFYMLSIVSFHVIKSLQCFAMVLLDFSIIFPSCYPSVSNAYPNAPSTIPTVAPYKRFCSFLPWFSIPFFYIHSGPTSKLQFFHCFSIDPRVLYAIMVGPGGNRFYLASFYPHPILSTVFPRVLINFPTVLLKVYHVAFTMFLPPNFLICVKVPPRGASVFLIIFPSLTHFVRIVLCHTSPQPS